MILVLAAEIYPMKTKGCHPVEKLILLKAAFTCAPKETNNWKALKGIPKLSQSFTTVFSPSHSCHGVNSHLVYVGKSSHYSEPNYTCFSILIVLNYAQFQKFKKKKKSGICVYKGICSSDSLELFKWERVFFPHFLLLFLLSHSALNCTDVISGSRFAATGLETAKLTSLHLVYSYGLP